MSDCRVLALLPFLVKRARSIEVFRAIGDEAIDVTVAFCDDASALYAPDEMEDFIARDRLIDLSRSDPVESFNILDEAISEREIDLVVQVGASCLYPSLPRWKESNPGIRVTDVLYNEYGHTLNHFLYERCIDSVIVESEHMRRFVERVSSKPQPEIDVVSSGIDLELFTPRDRRPRDGWTLTVGYVGRMSEEKNPMGFVDLAERLLELDPHLHFQMTGEGPLGHAVVRRLADSPHAGRIVYEGFVDGSLAALHNLDVLVLPSRFDGHPAIVMEANACGIPVVAAPVGGVPELIEEGVNGYLMHPEQTLAIHELVSGWKASPDALADLQRSAREYACRMFDCRQMTSDYARAFRRIVAASGRTVTEAPTAAEPTPAA